MEAVEQEVIEAEAEAEPQAEAPVAEAVEEPVAEAEAVVEAAPEPEPVVSINEDAELEELLRLEAEEAAEEEMEERQPEPAGISVDDDSIWVLPETIRSPSVLRFAEDIMPAERGRARAERDRRPDPNAAPASPDNRPRAKKGKRSR